MTINPGFSQMARATRAQQLSDALSIRHQMNLNGNLHGVERMTEQIEALEKLIGPTEKETK